MAHADAVLADTAPKPPDRRALQALIGELDALSEPLQDASLGAHMAQTQRTEATREMLLRQRQFSWLLAALQGALLLSVAWLLLRRWWQARAQAELALLAEERQAARLAAEAANRAKSAFLANMSHELRTPFHGMLGMLALLERTPLNPQQRDYVRAAQRSAAHLLDILNDILDLSKLESGRMTVQPAAVAVAQLLRDVERLMRPLAIDKGLLLLVEQQHDLPAHVSLDGLRLKQILFNLVGNAIKFSSHGVVRLHAGARGLGSDAAMLTFSVSDSGPGIDPAALGRLFSRFQQGDDSLTRAHGGTGLGLEISRNLARLMGGDIDVVSQPGQGAIFTVTLPLQPVSRPVHAQDAGADDQRRWPALADGGRAHASALPAGMRVLVCEDHDINRQYLGALLEELGARASFCDNGAQAVQQVRDHDFDLVLMDVHTPVLDGVAATRAIRALPPPRGNVPVLALTADAFDDARQRALAAGMNEFLTKPLHPDQLRAALARHAPAQPASTPAAVGMPAAARPSALPGRGWFDGAAAGGAALAPWFDSDALRRLSRSLSAARYRQISLQLLNDDQGTVRALGDALRLGEVADAIAQAHALKGAASNLGMSELARQAADIEARARAGRLPAAEGSQVGLSTAIAHSREALDALLPPAPG